jgi:toxin secretion/phage lysis holin
VGVKMNQFCKFKIGFCSILGTIGAFISMLFGGWSSALTTLVIFMAIDYFSGFIVAAVFHKSDKSEKGGLESKAGWKGLSKKGMILLIVLIAHRLDLAVGSTFIRDAVTIGYIVNEALSIIENAGLMGIPIPSVITNAIDVLKSNSEIVQSKKDTKD